MSDEDASDLLDAMEALLEYTEKYVDGGCWHLSQSARVAELLTKHGRSHDCEMVDP
jgi:hypothetical protein